MHRLFLNVLIFAISGVCTYLSLYYFHGKFALLSAFISGLFFGILLMNIKLNVKNDKILSYKRELEKESISSTESEARVKVLESKINVLEKALENALNK